MCVSVKKQQVLLIDCVGNQQKKLKTVKKGKCKGSCASLQKSPFRDENLSPPMWGHFPPKMQQSLVVRAGHYLSQSCGSLGNVEPGAPPVNYVESMLDCVGAVSGFSVHGSEVNLTNRSGGGQAH